MLLICRSWSRAKPLPRTFIYSTFDWRRCLSNGKKPYDPLRILFCGADEFSNYSLQALNELRLEKPETIASIDVVCRPDKRTGRGLKKITQVPIKPAAQSLGLPIHQIDTFTGWSPPSPIDLVIAVSFGLLVPPRILSAATYGGLNVHPSLLPQFRGASPLLKVLLEGWPSTGVSLQTMHPSKFDQGIIIAQTPGISVPENAVVQDLIDLLSPLGAEVLVKGIEDGLFLDPKPVIDNDISQPGLIYAPKMTKEDARIDWKSWNSAAIIRRGRLLDLWDETTYQACGMKESKRVIFRGPWTQYNGDAKKLMLGTPESGQPVLYSENNNEARRFALLAADGGLVMPALASIEGKPKGRGIPELIRGLEAALVKKVELPLK